MKRIILFIAIVVFTFGTTHAEKNVGSTGLNNSPSTTNGKTGAFDCSPSTSQIDLDINNIRARILAGGDFWWDGVETAQYEVPKIDPSSGATPLSTLFTGALWFTGLDNGGNLQCAAQTYRAAGRHDFYTGPLSGNLGEVSFDVCSAYDEHFEVFAEEINEVRALFLASGGTPIPSSQIPTNVLRWPGKGNPYYLNNETDKYFNEGSLAPFFDVDGNDIYDPTKGDFPVIGVSTNGVVTPNFADQMIFWVINDNGQVHGRTGGVPIGVQVNCLAFAYSTADALNNMTFYTFEVIKKTPNQTFEAYMGVFVDPDLGNATDDFIGCDTTREMGFVYNAGATDGNYGPNPPLVAIDFFEGPLDDNGNQLGLSSFVYFNNATSGAQTDPDDAAEFRNYQTGKWKDGTAVVFGGSGYGAGIPTNYVYPGNPFNQNDPQDWSECSAGSNPDDRRFVQNSGPFTLDPGDPQRISIGVITIFPTNYIGCPDVDAIFGVADDLAQSLFDNNFDIIDGPDAPTLAIREFSNEIIINLVNEEGSNNFGENYAEDHALPNNGVPGNDTEYKFQGYMLYQLKNIKVTAQDLSDPTKAVLIYQSDLKDETSSIYNYSNNGADTYNATLKVDGANIGVGRSFVVTEDQFAEGDRALVNNRKYYFAAIAYASSDYEPYPSVASLPDLEIFKQGRGNFKTYSAIPHNTDTRNGGTVLQAEAGDALSVFRHEGEGNGGIAIRLTEETEADIVASSNAFVDILEYDLGYDPIVARVVDPLKLQNVDFELRFEAYTQFPDTTFDSTILQTSIFPFMDSLVIDTLLGTRYDPAVFFSDSNYWSMWVTNENGTPIDTIFADRDFNREYQQMVPEYGISINVNIPLSSLVNIDNNEPVYSPLSSSIEFEDVTKPWLSFVTDEGFATPTNWIRSGSNVTSVPVNRGIFDDHQYDNLSGPSSSIFYDPTNTEGATIFGASLLNGKIAPYCLAANYANPDVTISEGKPEYSYGPAFRWDQWNVNGNNTIVENPINTLDDLRSVSIVISSDFDTWTNSPIFETSDNLIKGSVISSVGRFPGYAINLETGERLNIAFGEASDLGGYNGGDNIWNPTSDLNDASTQIPGLDEIYTVPIWGGKHFVYVFNSRYDVNFASDIKALYDANPITTGAGDTIPTVLANVYKDIMYTFIPVLAEGYDFTSPIDIPTKARITINIDRPFLPLGTSESLTFESNRTLPRYKFSTIGLAPLENQEEVAKNGLENIRVVPNPYYAYSAYEESQIENVVKIVGLPDNCEVSIYSIDGKLVRKFDRAVGNSSNTVSNRQEIASGQAIGSGINLDNSISWNLQNSNRIPIGSGTYIIHINSFDLGETVVKAAVFMRPTDVSNF